MYSSSRASSILTTEEPSLPYSSPPRSPPLAFSLPSDSHKASLLAADSSNQPVSFDEDNDDDDYDEEDPLASPLYHDQYSSNESYISSESEDKELTEYHPGDMCFPDGVTDDEREAYMAKYKKELEFPEKEEMFFSNAPSGSAVRFAKFASACRVYFLYCMILVANLCANRISSIV